MRLDKYLCECGFGSRAEVKKILKKNTVTVNGITVNDGKLQVTEESEVIVNGEQMDFPGKTYYMFYKPAGCICAAVDAKEKTIFSYVPQNRKGTLASAGRLDKDTEGLLIITDDGDFNHRLVSPRKHVNKIYYTEVTGKLTKEDEAAFETGLDIGDEKLTLSAKLIRLSENHCEDSEQQPWQIHAKNTGDSSCYIVVHEGRYHQVKRMAKACGHEVTYLKRVAMGGLVLDPELKPGEYRRLTAEEIKLAEEE